MRMRKFKDTLLRELRSVSLNFQPYDKLCLHEVFKRKEKDIIMINDLLITFFALYTWLHLDIVRGYSTVDVNSEKVLIF